MLQRAVGNSDQLKNALGDLGFEHNSALQKIVDMDKDVLSIRNGTADDATKARVRETFRQSAIADPLRRKKQAQANYRWHSRQLKAIEDRDIINMANGDQFHFMSCMSAGLATMSMCLCSRH